jgi:hypothetical protein
MSARTKKAWPIAYANWPRHSEWAEEELNLRPLAYQTAYDLPVNSDIASHFPSDSPAIRPTLSEAMSEVAVPICPQFNTNKLNLILDW